MADLVTSRIFIDGEKGITATKLNDIVGGSSIQPAFYSAKPTASTADPADTLLLLKAAGSYAQIPFSAVTTSVAGQLPSADAEIWSVRLRSFNACGNPNFEVDQRNCGNSVNVTSLGTAWVDRWQLSASYATIGVSGRQMSEKIPVPGTDFLITQKFHRTTVTAAAPTLAATAFVAITQIVEGPQLRELLGDVHSISILCRSNVADLKFGLSLQDPASAHTLGKLCTLGSANTWSLITLPNLPLWAPSGDFSITPGTLGYYLGLNLAAGSTYTLSANDTWQNSAAFGAAGQSNFAAANGNTFDLAFVQHEPGAGAGCSTLMDKPFSENLDECLRYFQKTYNYATAPGSITPNGAFQFTQLTTAAAQPTGPYLFKKTMAKTPTLNCYSSASGVGPLRVADLQSVSDRVVSAVNFLGENGYSNLPLTTYNAAPANYVWHHTADTGW